MKTFIQAVTEDLLSKHGTDLSDVVVVFPNKRASLFMNRHLWARVQKPIFTPRYMTISELFHSKSNLTVADKITSVCALYKAYCNATKSTETIDEFWSWGEVMLSDFDDIDKHLGNPAAILRNVSDLHAYDSTSFLTPEQCDALNEFFGNFSDDKESELKQRFASLWDNLLPIYERFNADLKAQNIAYEGAIYRDVAQRAAELEWEHRAYIFVGFNMLWKAEQTLFTVLKSRGLAHFYWDYDNYYVDDHRQEAGHYLRKWAQPFPNELDATDAALYSNLTEPRDITYLSASSENIQARYVSQWLEEKGEQRLTEGESTAIVLADESLLKSVIHYLPESVSGKANITIGFPLSETPVASLVDNFLFLHIYCFNAGQQSYVLRQVKTLLAHPYISILLADEEEKKQEEKKEESFCQKIIDSQAITMAKEELCQSEVATLLFEPLDAERQDANRTLLTRLLTLLHRIGQVSEKRRFTSCDEVPSEPSEPTYEEQMMQESVYQMHNRLNLLLDILDKEEMPLTPRTLRSLIGQITASTTMPFHGEPIADLQITGMLETRNLDFQHLLILSCNEGNIPRGVLSTSLLPYVVRKAHGLTTPEDKVAVYAYYFYRLLQRCGDASIAFNATTEDGQTGEMSRFMLQLMADADRNNFCFHHLTLTAEQQSQADAPKEVVEKGDLMNDITSLSPSAINQYMRCPMRFYFEKIAGFKGPDSDSIEDARTFGNVFHGAAENIYNDISDSQGQVTKEAIEALLNDNEARLRYVDNAFSHVLFAGKEPHYDGLQLINRKVICDLVRLLLEADKEQTPFTVKGLEKSIYGDLTFQVAGQERTIRVGGKIDRLDQVTTDHGPVLRVIDYKTGSTMQKVLAGVEEVFDKKKIDDYHSDYYLQAMLYSWLVRHSQQPFDYKGEEHAPLNEGNLPVQPALFFVQKKESRLDPVLKFKAPKDPDVPKGTKTQKEPKAEALPIVDIKDHEEAYVEGLRRVVAEIYDPNVPFTTRPSENSCKHCDFLSLCRKEEEGSN